MQSDTVQPTEVSRACEEASKPAASFCRLSAEQGWQFGSAASYSHPAQQVSEQVRSPASGSFMRSFRGLLGVFSCSVIYLTALNGI